jgi:hypothetical protein
LIETAFRQRCPADDPETYVLAWLIAVGLAADVPRAAGLLAARLSRLRLGVRSPWQRRLLELLHFIARHRRRPRAGTRRLIKISNMEGMS